jgi:hypothetical protein
VVSRRTRMKRNARHHAEKGPERENVAFRAA